MSSTPASALGWLPTIPTECPPSRANPQTMFSAIPLVHLEKLAVVDDAPHDVLHVVRLVRIVGDQRVELGVLPVDGVGRLPERRRVEVVLRQEREEVPRVLEAGLLARRHELRDAGLRRMRRRSAELLEAHLLAGHRLHHVGTGDEHVRRPLDHEHEVGHRRRVDRAARRRPHDEADLRDDAGGLDVPPEDLRVAGERDDSLLDPRAARVVDADQRAAELRREVHHLADLLGERLRQAAAEDREVLREDEDLAAEDRPVAGDDRVPVRPPIHHPEERIPVAHVAVELDERARIEQLLRALAGEQLALLTLPRDRLLAARVQRLVAQLLELLELPLRRIVGPAMASETSGSAGDVARLLGREHQARGRTPTRQGSHRPWSGARVDSGAA